MTKPRSINLKHTILVSFLLLSLLSPLKSIATNHNRNGEPIYIITDSRWNEENIGRLFVTTRNRFVLRTDSHTLSQIKKALYVCHDSIVVRDSFTLLLIVDSTCISLYNYFTGHNKRKSKWYHGKFFLYAGRKINITKNFYLDLYFNLLKSLVPIILSFIFKNVRLLLLTIHLYINIRIYKNFYLSFNLMAIICTVLVHIISFNIYSETKEYLLYLFPNELPQNFNLSDIRCHFRR